MDVKPGCGLVEENLRYKITGARQREGEQDDRQGNRDVKRVRHCQLPAFLTVWEGAVHAPSCPADGHGTAAGQVTLTAFSRLAMLKQACGGLSEPVVRDMYSTAPGPQTEHGAWERAYLIVAEFVTHAARAGSGIQNEGGIGWKT